jgi:hypothetical protein
VCLLGKKNLEIVSALSPVRMYFTQEKKAVKGDGPMARAGRLNGEFARGKDTVDIWLTDIIQCKEAEV